MSKRLVRTHELIFPRTFYSTGVRKKRKVGYRDLNIPFASTSVFSNPYQRDVEWSTNVERSDRTLDSRRSMGLMNAGIRDYIKNNGRIHLRTSTLDDSYFTPDDMTKAARVYDTLKPLYEQRLYPSLREQIEKERAEREKNMALISKQGEQRHGEPPPKSVQEEALKLAKPLKPYQPYQPTAEEIRRKKEEVDDDADIETPQPSTKVTATPFGRDTSVYDTMDVDDYSDLAMTFDDEAGPYPYEDEINLKEFETPEKVDDTGASNPIGVEPLKVETSEVNPPQKVEIADAPTLHTTTEKKNPITTEYSSPVKTKKITPAQRNKAVLQSIAWVNDLAQTNKNGVITLKPQGKIVQPFIESYINEVNKIVRKMDSEIPITDEEWQALKDMQTDLGKLEFPVNVSMFTPQSAYEFWRQIGVPA